MTELRAPRFGTGCGGMPWGTRDDCGVVFAAHVVAGPPKLNVGRGGCARADSCEAGFELAGTAVIDGAGVVEVPVGAVGDGNKAADVPLSCSPRDACRPLAKDENGVECDEEKAGDCCCD